MSVGYYAVCIIDILGQQERLRQWSSLPADDRFMNALRQSAGAALSFRESFERHFDAFQNTVGTGLTDPSHIAVAKRVRECRLSVRQFSDTFLFFSPMRNSHGDVSPEPFYRLLCSAAIAMLHSLAREVPVRGAMCIGLGIELSSDSFYGPAVAAAHRLESEVAKYPRVVIDDEILDFLAAKDAHFSSHEGTNNIMAAMAKACGRWIARDQDGRAIVDFLGPEMVSINRDRASEMQGFLATIVAFVERELARFRAGGEAQDVLRYRYEQLQNYINSRLPLWR